MESNEQKPQNKINPLKLLITPLVKLKELLLNRYVFLVLGVSAGFVVGARLHETGNLAGLFGKDLKGSTILLSGKCKVGDVVREPNLSDTEVKVVYIDGKKIEGIVKKTTEYVSCALPEVVIETLPALKDILTTPSSSPAVVMPVKKIAKEPEFKKLEKKTLLMSGSCVELTSGNVLPAFVDELVAVTEVAGTDDKNIEDFALAGIRKSDKVQIKCLSNAITYKIADEDDLVKPEKEDTSLLSKNLLITGTCFPDPRTSATKQVGDKLVKVSYISLTNNLIQVTDESYDSETKKLKRLFGKILQNYKLPNGLNMKGFDVVCDSKRFNFVYKIYDPNVDKLDFEDTAFSEKKEEVSKPVEVKPVLEQTAPQE